VRKKKREWFHDWFGERRGLDFLSVKEGKCGFLAGGIETAPKGFHSWEKRSRKAPSAKSDHITQTEPMAHCHGKVSRGDWDGDGFTENVFAFIFPK